MEKALIILSHGSRSSEFQESFGQIVEMVRNKRKDLLVYGANMELCSPTIGEVVMKAVAENNNLKKIAIAPYFLFEGIHIKEDIPEIIKRLEGEYKNIEFSFGKPLGVDPSLADLLIKRAEDII